MSILLLTCKLSKESIANAKFNKSCKPLASGDKINHWHSQK